MTVRDLSVGVERDGRLLSRELRALMARYSQTAVVFSLMGGWFLLGAFTWAAAWPHAWAYWALAFVSARYGARAGRRFVAIAGTLSQIEEIMAEAREAPAIVAQFAGEYP